MIILYSGTPGSGKSCHQAEDILEYMRSRRAVVMANYEVNEELIKKYAHEEAQFIYTPNELITPENLMKFSQMHFKTHPFHEGVIHLYIDESQLIFNAREWDAKGRKEWIKFFTQHRKYGYDIYLIAQFDRMLDRQIRSLIEYEYKHRKISNGGVKGKALSLALGGNTYLAVRYWYPMQEKLSAEVHHIRKRYYSLYDSYKDFDNTAEGIRESINEYEENKKTEKGKKEPEQTISHQQEAITTT